MTTRKRLAGTTLLIASVIVLTGCSGHAAAAPSAPATSSPLGSVVAKATKLPGIVQGTDQAGDVLVELTPRYSSAAGVPEIRDLPYPDEASSQEDDWAIFDANGVERTWSLPAGHLEPTMTAAGLFVEDTTNQATGSRELERIDPATGAVLWRFAEQTAAGDQYGVPFDEADFLPPRLGVGDLVALDHRLSPEQQSAADAPSDEQIAMLDAGTGAVRFAIANPGIADGGQHIGRVLSYDPFITAVTSDKQKGYLSVQLRDDSTGAVVKQLDPSLFGGNVLVDGAVLLSSTGKGSTTTVTAKDLSGTKLWSTKVDVKGAVVSDADERDILVTGRSGFGVRVLDAKTGELLGGYTDADGTAGGFELDAGEGAWFVSADVIAVSGYPSDQRDQDTVMLPAPHTEASKK
jgi:hypothetical protein